MSTPATNAATSAPTKALPACRLCGHRDHWLGEHLAEAHSLSVPDYLRSFPGAPTASQDLVDASARTWNDKVTRIHPPKVTDLRINFAGVEVKVNHDVPADACLRLPSAYRVPEYGALANDVRAAAISLVSGRSTYIWGLPGSGKDALIHAWSAMTRTPGLIFQVEPAADIRSWFFSHEFNKDGTYWEEGELLRALRDGYTSPVSGRKIPYLILITDFDRATKEQAESLRLVMDSIQGRVKGPGGVTYNVLPGTLIIVTANTSGAGDTRGRCISSNVIDASMLDRFERAYEFHWMDWKDEEIIAKEKFPLLVERCPTVFPQMGAVTKALRDAIYSDRLYAEFSHRGLCSVLGAAEDIVRVTGKVPKDVLKLAFRAYTDKLPDQETRETAIRLADPHIAGGVLDAGSGPAKPKR